MGPNFTPLSSPQSPAPSGPQAPKPHKKMNKSVFSVIAVLVIMTGIVGGFIAMQTGFLFKPRASGDGTSYYSNGTGRSMTYDGKYVTVNDSKGDTPLKLISYKANQPYWGDTWVAVGAYTVNEVTNGSKVEVPCGYFQEDLLPKSAKEYASPSVGGNRYGVPGDGTLLASVNGTRICTVTPTKTPTPKPSNTPTKPPPTSTPKPSPTPTKVPSCGSACSSDSQCGADMKCYNTSVGTYNSPTGKCVLAKCLQAGVVCSADKCNVIPPTPTPTLTNTPTPTKTPTPKATNTPPPTATLSCPKPNPVKNLRINCPICKGT